MSHLATLGVAAAQIRCVPGDLEANVRTHLDAIDAARARHTDVLVFPELSITGHHGGAQALQVAIRLDDARIRAIAEAAGPMSTTFGIVEEGDAALFYNSAVTVRDGGIAHVHRKVNLATYGRLDDGKHFGAGRSVEGFPVRSLWRASVLICADTWNPALVHVAALKGTTLLLVPVSSAVEAVDPAFDNAAGWSVNVTFHALTYGMPVVMANRIGAEGDLSFWGGSRIVDPFGNVVASASSDEALVAARLDYDDVRTARYRLPTVRDANLSMLRDELARLAHRRPTS